MALDNFDRVQSINAIIEAWTRYGSLPFIIYKWDLAPNASISFDVSTPWDAFLLFYGSSSNQVGSIMSHYENGVNASRYVLTPSAIQYTRSGNRFTVKNIDATNNADIYVITLRGSAEEV